MLLPGISLFTMIAAKNTNETPDLALIFIKNLTEKMI